MQYRIFVFLTVIGSLLFSGCNKDDTGNTPNTPQVACRLVEQSEGPDTGNTTPTESYLYDPNHRLVQINYNGSQGTTGSYSLISYNAAGKPNKMESYSNGASNYYIQYEYDNQGRLLNSIYYERSNPGAFFEVSSWLTREYNAANQISKESYFTDSSGVPETYFLYEYTGGNITRVREFLSDGPGQPFQEEAVVDITYDNKPSFYSGIHPAITEEYSANNKTSVTIKYGNVVLQDDSYTYAHEYNPQGYPIKTTYANLAGDDSGVYLRNFNCP